MPSADARSRLLLQVAAGVLLLVLRAFTLPFTALWHDWIAAFAIYGIALACLPDPRARSRATLVAMAWLLGVYAAGHLPVLRRLLEISS